MSKASAYFVLDSVTDPHDTKQIKKDLDRLPGVLSVSVDNTRSRIAVDYDDTGVKQRQIAQQLIDAGYDITTDNGQKHVM